MYTRAMPGAKTEIPADEWEGNMTRTYSQTPAFSQAGVLILLAVLFCFEARPQAVTSTLLGTVVDSSGAVVPNAAVTATETRTGVTKKAATSAEGNYTIPYLIPGVYRVEVEITGFKKFSRDNVELKIAAAIRVDARLEPGSVSETVEVKAESPLLQTDRSEVARSFASETVRELPIANRNFQSLVGLVAGVTPPTQGTSLEDPQGTNYYQANGQWNSANNTQVDGIDNNDPFIGVSIHIPPAEAIHEVNVSTSNYNAEFGRAGGAILNVATRGGTNELHGSLFEFFRNTHLRARNMFNVSPQPKPAFNRNQFGGTAGGPIKKDKTFFFASFQGTYLHQASTQTQTLPVASWRQGNFADVSGLNLFDPATGNRDGTGRAPFAGNQIPTARFHPVANKLLPYLPSPNMPGLQNNFITNVGFQNDAKGIDTRVDHNFSQKAAIFVKYSFIKYDLINEAALGRKVGEGVMNDQQTHTASINFNYTFNPTLLAEVRFGYNRYNPVVNGIDMSLKNSDLGIRNPNPDEISEGGMARVDISGMQGMGTPVTRPLVNADNIFNWVNNWNKIVSRHTIKWGADIRRLRLDRFQPQGLNLGPRGLFNFNPGTTALRGGPALGPFGTFGNSFAAFLIGAPDRTSRTYMPITPTNRQTNFFAFVHDTYQVTKNLTLDMGLRYELYTTVKPRYAGGASNYDPATNSLLVAGVGDVGLSTNVDVDPNNFAPRFGFSYRMGQKSVVRGGYGISYYTGRYGFTGGTLSTQFPVLYNIQNGVTGDFIVDGTFDILPVVPIIDIPSNGRITPAPAQAFFVIPRNNRYPYVQSFNLTYQRELGNSITWDVSYVGSLGRKLQYNLEINAAAPGTGTAGLPLNQRFGRTASTQERSHGINNNYNSLQTNLNKRFSGGLGFTVAYTYSKALDVGSDQPGFTNNLDWGANYGLANFDRTHMLNISHVYELPFGPGKRHLIEGPASWLLRNWQLNGIFRIVSGTPVNITADATPCNCPGNGNYADFLSAVKYLNGHGPGELWFDRASFAAPAANRWGTGGRNVVRGPGFTNYDFSVFRTFPIRERVNLEFRSEFYNLTNTPRWGNPAGNVNSGTFAQITSASGEREIQFALRLLF